MLSFYGGNMRYIVDLTPDAAVRVDHACALLDIESHEVFILKAIHFLTNLAEEINKGGKLWVEYEDKVVRILL